MEPSDVVVECAKLAIGGEPDRPREEGRGSSRTSQDFTNTFGKSHTVLKLRCINKSTFFILKFESNTYSKPTYANDSNFIMSAKNERKLEIQAYIE